MSDPHKSEPRPRPSDLHLALHLVDDLSPLCARWLKGEVLALQKELSEAKLMIELHNRVMETKSAEINRLTAAQQKGTQRG